MHYVSLGVSSHFSVCGQLQCVCAFYVYGHIFDSCALLLCARALYGHIFAVYTHLTNVHTFDVHLLDGHICDVYTHLIVHDHNFRV